jgi:hypothetical protein
VRNEEDDMNLDEKIAKLQDLARRLSKLAEDPQPGLGTWAMFVGRVLTEIAEFAPASPGAKVFTVIQQGVYRHTIGGVFSTLEAAIVAADDIAAQDRDDHHDYEVHAWTMDEHPAIEHDDVYSVNRSTALAKRVAKRVLASEGVPDA